jgi:hypothetical protein
MAEVSGNGKKPMYGQDFYERYAEYLDEPVVREMHGWVIGTLVENGFRDRVLDLGCGRSREFRRHCEPNAYLGMDVNAEQCYPETVDRQSVRCDYRTCLDNSDTLRLIQAFRPWAFVSLFSSEIMDAPKQNYKFYARLFTEIPHIQRGLVSGFYYASRKDLALVEEAGGVRSYQTLEHMESVQSKVFEERRVTIHVPSKMFGDDVYEIWKLFLRF